MALSPNQTTYDDETRAKAKELYVSGKATNFTDVARILGLPRPSTVRNWAVAEGWDAEKIARLKPDDVAVVRTSLQKYVEEQVQEVLNRHIANGIALQEKALEWMGMIPPKTFQELVQMMTFGVELERVSRGMTPLQGGKGKGQDGALTADVILASFKQITVNVNSDPETKKKLAGLIDATCVPTDAEDSASPN